MIFVLTKIIYIRIIYNIDKENKDKAIYSLSGKAVYNKEKQIGTVVLSSYNTYLLDWIKFKDSCAFYKKKYSFRDEIWRANCWDHIYY